MIGLLTDFGNQDSYAAEMKGVIHTINQQAQIIDITHGIPPGDIEAAAFLLERCWQSFPSKTVFCAVIDPGVGTNRYPVMGKYNQIYFIGPDNGLFSYFYPPQQVRIIPEYLSRKTPGKTFQGRDLFAVAAAHLDQDQDNFLNSKGLPCSHQLVRLKTDPRPKVMWIDNFGNVILSVKPEHLKNDRGKLNMKWRNYTFTEIYRNYQSLGQDNIGLVVGGSGYLEIAARDTQAAKILNINRGDILDV
jgi:S-adenosyl-L-methionine hydrolase (adenosine-forming)